MGQRVIELRALVALFVFVVMPLSALAQERGASAGGSSGSQRAVKASYFDPASLKFRLQDCDQIFVDQTALLWDHLVRPVFHSFDYSPHEYRFSGDPLSPVHYGEPSHENNTVDLVAIFGAEVVRSYIPFPSRSLMLEFAEESLASILNSAIVNVEVNKSPGLGVIYAVAEKALIRERMTIQLFKRDPKLLTVFKTLKQNRSDRTTDPMEGLNAAQRAFVESLGVLTDEDLTVLSEEVESTSRIYDGTKSHYGSDPTLPVELMYRIRDMDPWSIRLIRDQMPNRQIYEFGAYKIPRLIKKIPGESPARRLLRLKLVMNQYVQKFMHWSFFNEKFVRPELERLGEAKRGYEKKFLQLHLAEVRLAELSSSWTKRRIYSKTIKTLVEKVKILRGEKDILNAKANSPAVFVAHFARNADPVLHERELGFKVMQQDPIFLIDSSPQNGGRFLIDVATGKKIPQIDPITGTQSMESISTVDAVGLAPKLKTLLENLKTKIKNLDLLLREIERDKSVSDESQLGDTP
ncbi:MAG: hypothetical protein JST80_13420 [Bdellovibrionales bacterium]|nr:hypothetical protein [Bdellovibrionales bacterium]